MVELSHFFIFHGSRRCVACPRLLPTASYMTIHTSKSAGSSCNLTRIFRSPSTRTRIIADEKPRSETVVFTFARQIDMRNVRVVFSNRCQTPLRWCRKRDFELSCFGREGTRGTNWVGLYSTSGYVGES